MAESLFPLSRHVRLCWRSRTALSLQARTCANVYASGLSFIFALCVFPANIFCFARAPVWLRVRLRALIFFARLSTCFFLCARDCLFGRERSWRRRTTSFVFVRTCVCVPGPGRLFSLRALSELAPASFHFFRGKSVKYSTDSPKRNDHIVRQILLPNLQTCSLKYKAQNDQISYLAQSDQLSTCGYNGPRSKQKLVNKVTGENIWPKINSGNNT